MIIFFLVYGAGTEDSNRALIALLNLVLNRERALFYGGKMVSSALASSEYYDKMKKSIVISFVDGMLFPQNPNLHTEFLLRETQRGDILADRLAIHFLELDKIGTEGEFSKMSSLERFCAYLKYAGNEEQFRREGLSKGLEQGLEQGLSKGQLVAKQEIAHKMKAAGMKLEEIIALTGLTAEQIKDA